MKEFNVKRQIGPVRVRFSHRSPRGVLGPGWGRFGGGWNWKCGFQIGGRTLIVDLLVCSLRFDLVFPEDK